MSLIDYFLYPQASGYDVPKTFLYGIVLVISAYLIYKLLERMKVKIDKRLAVAVSPYVVFGSAVRMLVDAGKFQSYFFVTPGIYFFVAFIVLSLLALSVILDRKKNIPYYKTLFTSGLLILSATISFISIANTKGALLIFLLFAPWLVVLIAVKWKNENKIVTALHMLDANTTFTAMTFFGYYEQHVLPSFLISMSSPAIFIFAKAIVIVSILFAIDKYSSEKQFNNYLKLCIGILGAATFARDFMRLAAMV